jgi:hypothetical protein
VYLLRHAPSPAASNLQCNATPRWMRCSESDEHHRIVSMDAYLSRSDSLGGPRQRLIRWTTRRGIGGVPPPRRPAPPQCIRRERSVSSVVRETKCARTGAGGGEGESSRRVVGGRRRRQVEVGLQQPLGSHGEPSPSRRRGHHLVLHVVEHLRGKPAACTSQ